MHADAKDRPRFYTFLDIIIGRNHAHDTRPIIAIETLTAGPERGTSGSDARTRLLHLTLRRLRPLRGLPVWARYGLTTLLVAVFVALRAALGADMTASPYLLFIPAIILCSFGFDRGTGFYATALSAAFATAHAPETVVSGLSLAVFILIGLFCAIIIEALRITVEELAEYEEQLERDLALRQQAEIALSESEARFRATFEHAAAGVALVGLDGRWLRVNRRLCDKLGYTEEEMLRLTFQDITHPDDLDADLSNVQQLLAGETSTYNMEKRYIRKDGSLIWILLTVGLVRGADGAPQYFISVIQDISSRKAAESVLSRDRAELEQLVEERTAALMRAAEDRRRAEDALRQGEKLQALGQLTGGIAHDFNNFLQVVGGGADLLSARASRRGGGATSSWVSPRPRRTPPT